MQDFQQSQQAFIDHIKDPKKHPVVKGSEEIEDRRLNIYRELFFNNINGFITSGFPVLKSLFDEHYDEHYDESRWQALVRDFFIRHDCHSPYFVDIAKEFIDYLVNEREANSQDWPFMIELAHYEWVELDVSIRQEQHHYRWLTTKEIETTPMVLSETAWPLSYTFPVHEISADYMPTEAVPGGVSLIVYRDVEDDVQFMLINGVTALLLQLLADNPGTPFDTLVEALVTQLPQFEAQQITEGATDMIQMLVGKGIIRGFSDT